MKRIHAILLAVIMLLGMIPGIVTANAEASSTQSDAKCTDTQRFEKAEEARIRLPAGVPEIIQMKDLSEYAQVMSGLEKLSKDAQKQGEDLCARERFFNSRVLLKGVPDFAGFKPLQVILDPYGYYVIQFGSVSEAERFIETQSSNPAVVWAEQDAIVYLDEPDADTEEDGPYNDAHLGIASTKYVQAEELVKYIYENGLDREVTVAVLDHGCELTHSFLKDRLVPNPPEGTICDFVQGDNDPSDENGHGTHVAGTIVECTGDDQRALNVRIMPVRVLGGGIWAIASGIYYAADNGADVINMSLTVDTEFGSVEDAVRYAVDKGCVVCAASGNDGHNNWNKEPSNSLYPGVITVGALQQTDQDWSICYFSNFGESVDIAAPGWNIWSSVLNNKFDYKSGTSMATPHVAAAAAMIRQIYPGLPPATVEELLTAATVDAGEPGRDDYYGYGNLQMAKILEIDPHAPSVTRSPEAVSTEWGTTASFSAAGEGIGLTYQWEYRENEAAEWKDVADESGKSADYMVLALDEVNGYAYRCRIENYWGCVYTEPAALTVTPRTESGPLAGGTFESGLAWEIDTDLTLRLYGEGWTDNYGRGEAPWYLWRNQIRALDIGSGVIAVCNYAFADLSKLTSVVIPEGMQYIGWSCFYNCDSLRWAVIPESLAEMDNYVFYDCDAFTDVFFKGDSLPRYYPGDDSNCYPSGTRIHMSYDGPVILGQAFDVDAVEGEQTSLALEAVGADPTYQWYYRTSVLFDWQMVTEEEGTMAEYPLLPSREMDCRQYRCLIKDMIGETYSDVITLHVAYGPPVITVQPRSQVVALDRRAFYSVTATGGGLRYQWEYRQAGTGEWMPVEDSSGTSRTLLVTCTAEKNGNEYRCVVSNSFGSVVSRTAILTLRSSPIPFRPIVIEPIRPIDPIKPIRPIRF